VLQKLKEKYKDIDLTTTQIFRVIRDNNITLKMTRIRHEPVKRFGKDIDINSKIKEFYEAVKKYKIEDIICLDETSIKSLQKRSHCYSILDRNQRTRYIFCGTQCQRPFQRELERLFGTYFEVF